jgi:hypothetical protein
MVQRPCLATSFDLRSWTKDAANPLFEPDSLLYYWHPAEPWSSWRDPFLFWQDGQWNMLSTAALRLQGYPGLRQGIVHLATSSDLINWQDQVALFRNDGDVIWHDLESSQYHIRNGWHHLFFGEYNVPGISHVVSATGDGWSMASRQIIDLGSAPEIDQFDPGIDIFSRWCAAEHPLSGRDFIVVRFDTLLFAQDGSAPAVHKPHPLAHDWPVRTGPSPVGNPTFGDNTAFRGQDSCGLHGNGWYGSQEFYQGPLSGYGEPGQALGDQATGTITSRPFVIEGDFIRLLVGGGFYPESCYVALLDARADTILVQETGHGSETMAVRWWDVRAWQGMLAAITIVDQETGPFGHINVDQIEELIAPVGLADISPARLLVEHGIQPNPGNPTCVLHFSLAQPCRVRIVIVDLQGRCLWQLGPIQKTSGRHTQIWQGQDQAGRSLASGVYLYKIELEGTTAASGKLTLLR